MTDYKAGQREFDRWLRDVHGLRLGSRTDHGLQKDGNGWEHFSWTMTVRNGYSAEEFPYRAGLAHRDKPTLVDIIAAVLSDARCVAYANGFEDFCDELGYDSDSRNAERIYREIQVNNGKILRLFNVVSLDSLLRQAEPFMDAAGL